MCKTFDTFANDTKWPPVIPGVTGKMVFEQMLTVLLGTGVGVAVVLYAVKPRQISASQSFLSGVSSVETISLPSQSTFSQNDAAPAPEATATQTAVVEPPVVGITAISSGSVSTLTAEVAAVGSSDSAIASLDAPAVSAPAARSASVRARAPSAARSHRAPRKSSASSRAHAKPRAVDGSTAIKSR